MSGRQGQHVADARGRRQDGEAKGRLQKHLPQFHALVEEMEQVHLGGQPQKDVHVGQPQVGVEQHHLAAHLGQAVGQIDGQVGFAHAALA